MRPIDEMWSPMRVETPTKGPEGCVNIDGRVIEEAGLRIAGLGGSMRYRPGPNQYSQAEMRWRAPPIEMLARPRRRLGGRRPDVLLTHAPPEGFGAQGNELAHRGLSPLKRLIKSLGPRPPV